MSYTVWINGRSRGVNKEFSPSAEEKGIVTFKPDYQLYSMTSKIVPVIMLLDNEKKKIVDKVDTTPLYAKRDNGRYSHQASFTAHHQEDPVAHINRWSADEEKEEWTKAAAAGRSETAEDCSRKDPRVRARM